MINEKQKDCITKALFFAFWFTVFSGVIGYTTYLVYTSPTEDNFDRSIRLFVREKLEQSQLEQSQVDDWVCFDAGNLWHRWCAIDTGTRLIKVECDEESCEEITE